MWLMMTSSGMTPSEAKNVELFGTQAIRGMGDDWAVGLFVGAGSGAQDLIFFWGDLSFPGRAFDQTGLQQRLAHTLVDLADEERSHLVDIHQLRIEVHRRPRFVKETGRADQLNLATAGDIEKQIEITPGADRRAFGHCADTGSIKLIHLGDHAISHLVAIKIENLGPAQQVPPNPHRDARESACAPVLPAAHRQ